MREGALEIEHEQSGWGTEFKACALKTAFIKAQKSGYE